MNCEHKFEWHLPGDGSQYGRLECLCVKCGKSKAEHVNEQEKALNKIRLLAKIGDIAIQEKKAFDIAIMANEEAVGCGYDNDSTGSLHVSLAYNRAAILSDELDELIKIYEKEYPHD